MGLETFTGIWSLNSANPVNATDPVSQGDDHIRGIKSALLATFPNIAGAVTVTHTVLNLVQDASNLNTGTLADARLSANVPLLNAANTFSKAGGNDQTIAASTTNRATVIFATNGATRAFVGAAGIANDLVNGTAVGDLIFRTQGGAAVMTLDSGANINHKFTTDNATTTFNGVAVSDFARLSQSNTFTGSTAGGRLHQFINTSAGATSYSDILTSNGVRNARLTMLSTGYSGGFFGAGPTGEHAALWVDGSVPLVFGTASEARFWIDGSGNFNFKSGTVTTNNASASEVGKTGAPRRNVSASGNTAATDQGGQIRFSGGVGQTFTLDSDCPVDTFVILSNDSGNPWTIAASGVLTWAATGTTGSRTIAEGGLAVALHQGSGNWKITGGGLS